MIIHANVLNLTVNEADPAIAGKLDVALTLLAFLKGLAMGNQEKIDAIAAAIDSATTGIKADIDALKAAVAAGATLDFSALDAKVAALAALDAENPAPTP